MLKLVKGGYFMPLDPPSDCRSLALLGPYSKYDRILGKITVSNSNCGVMLFSNNTLFCSQRGGRGSKKTKKLRSYIKYCHFDTLFLSNKSQLKFAYLVLTLIFTGILTNFDP